MRTDPPSISTESTHVDPPIPAEPPPTSATSPTVQQLLQNNLNTQDSQDDDTMYSCTSQDESYQEEEHNPQNLASPQYNNTPALTRADSTDGMDTASDTDDDSVLADWKASTEEQEKVREVVQYLNSNADFPPELIYNPTHNVQIMDNNNNCFTDLMNDDKHVAPCLTKSTHTEIDPAIYCTGYDIETKINHGLDYNTGWYGNMNDEPTIHATDISKNEDVCQKALDKLDSIMDEILRF